MPTWPGYSISGEGFTARDDTLPDRFFQPMEGGTLKGKKIDREQFSKALETYYEMMGWDSETGGSQEGKTCRAGP